MGHKVKVSGTAYDVQGGKCKVSGTAYDIKKGKTKVGGTAYNIDFIPPLNDFTWAEISSISASGQGANYWDVGDTKAVTLNGTVGTLSINATYWVYILGFNHNSNLEGNGIQFGTFKTAQSGGVDVCLVDSKYNTVVHNGTKAFNMSHWGDSSVANSYNYGGWAGCDARYDILGSTNKAPSGYGSVPTTSRVGYDASATTATNPVSNTLMSAFPRDLRAVMKPITKYTDAVGNSSNVLSNVKASVDYLPLLAEYEIKGRRSFANNYEQNYQKQYDYYVAGNSIIKYLHNNTSSGSNWLIRSPYYANEHYFCLVNASGTLINMGAPCKSCGLAPVFMV